MFTIINLIIVAAVWYVATFYFAPAVNAFFSCIWEEEERPVVKRETRERLNELIADGKVAEETALVMTAKEQGFEEEEILAVFGALNARDLANIVRAKGPAKVTQLLNMLDAVSKKGMRSRGK